MRLGLIPVSGGGIIIGAGIGMSMLDGKQQRLLENDGILYMKTIKGPFACIGKRPIRRAFRIRDSMIGAVIASGRQAPGGAEVILGAGSVK